ncbi:mannonate dehydratase [Gaetbulibacter saemankumensis]|uniref:mannonate dehydratase n=1 Tax=Gaetbulibacter saemankumensis TaxID=311208 RepID=UPI0009FE26B8
MESIPIHEDIKLKQVKYQKRIENHKQSLKNLAACDIKYMHYNVIIVLDWTSTHLFWKLDDKSPALRFDRVEMTVFEKIYHES